MRLFFICLLLAVAPIAAMVAYKQYQIDHPSELEVNWHSRGEVLFFNASWCGPCRQMKPIVTDLRREGYRLRDIDVDSHRELAQKYGISGVPTFVFIENGSEVDRFSGGTSPDNLRRLCSAPAYR